MSTFITRLNEGSGGMRVAVKDLIDVAGVPTTAGCRAVADMATAAEQDAACMRGIREAMAAGLARLVGKTNLHELAYGITGINPWFGTPRNPLDPRLVPGGSSSGSAVAVAEGEADVALGTDTGGSVRIPAACCGIVGLKTTWGRISTHGVWPLAPSLDTVGPMARDVDGVVVGMRLLEPGFEPDDKPPLRIGRLRVEANPEIDTAIDRALSASGFTVVDLDPGPWLTAARVGVGILDAQAWDSDGWLLAERRDRIGQDVAARIEGDAAAGAGRLAEARAAQRLWVRHLEDLWQRVELLALPTLVDFPPPLDHAGRMFTIRCTLPVNIAGVPALAVPVPAGSLPASLQLIAPQRGEERLLSAGRRIEQAVL
jgi:amidase